MVKIPDLSRLRRLTRRRQSGDVLYLDGGVVSCPRQGDVEFEVCLACPALSRVTGDPITSIECEARASLLRGAVAPF